MCECVFNEFLLHLLLQYKCCYLPAITAISLAIHQFMQLLLLAIVSLCVYAFSPHLIAAYQSILYFVLTFFVTFWKCIYLAINPQNISIVVVYSRCIYNIHRGERYRMIDEKFTRSFIS